MFESGKRSPSIFHWSDFIAHTCLDLPNNSKDFRAKFCICKIALSLDVMQLSMLRLGGGGGGKDLGYM